MEKFHFIVYHTRVERVKTSVEANSEEEAMHILHDRLKEEGFHYEEAEQYSVDYDIETIDLE